MILEEETYEKFGYYPRDLKFKSGKKILAACDECGKIRITSKNAYCALCKSCVRTGERSEKYVPKIKRVCQECGKNFKIHQSRIDRGDGRFCSIVCANKWHSKNYRGKNNPRWKGGKVKRICEECGSTFFATRATIRKGYGHCCSLSCAGKKKRRIHHAKPTKTKPERIFEEICKKHTLPFKYTGDSAFWIGKNPSINPDFVECNGKKIAIEIFSYWHDPLKRHCKVRYAATFEGRKKILKKYGWKLVVFWQEDLERKDAERFVLSVLSEYQDRDGRKHPKHRPSLNFTPLSIY